MKKKYEITNSGCDGFADCEIELTDAQYRFIERVFTAVNDGDHNCCSPIIRIEEIRTGPR